MMEVDRADGRSPNQLRPLACSRNLLNRAHGSARWSQGNTIVLAAVYGPKAGTRKNENPERASIEAIWKPKTGQIGKPEREYEMILKRTLQSICVLTIHPNTITSVILQVINDDGSLLPCAINAACAALLDAGIPLKHLAVAVCCGLTESGSVILDPTKLEEQKMQGFSYLVFPNSAHTVLLKGPSQMDSEPMEHGVITSVTHGVMPAHLRQAYGLIASDFMHTSTVSKSSLICPLLDLKALIPSLSAVLNDYNPKQAAELGGHVDDYLHSLERGRSASAKISDFIRRSLQSQVPDDPSKVK